MYSLSFSQELWLMLIDKAAIGAVGFGVWILVQRKLETYKAHQALWTEISKERIKHIACDGMKLTSGTDWLVIYTFISRHGSKVK